MNNDRKNDLAFAPASTTPIQAVPVMAAEAMTRVRVYIICYQIIIMYALTMAPASTMPIQAVPVMAADAIMRAPSVESGVSTIDIAP